MELTKVAQKLKELKENEEELTQETEELATCMGSEGFGYALYEGGYLKPKQWVAGKDLEELKEAIAIVGKFKDLVEELHEEF